MEQSQKIEFRKARDFGEVMNATSDFIRQNFKNLGLSLLFIAGPLIVLLGIVSGFNEVNVFTERVSRFTFSMFLTYIVMFFAVQMVIAVTYCYINLYLDRETNDISVEDVWQEVKLHFGTIVFTSLVGMLIIFGASILLVIPGIFYAVVLSIVFAVRMRERLPFSDSVSRSQSLVKDNWWKTFGLTIVLYLIIYVFSIVLSLPQMIVVFLSAFGLNHETTVISRTMMILTAIIASFNYLFQAIFHVGMSFQYYSLVEKKEALGLLEKIDHIKEQN